MIRGVLGAILMSSLIAGSAFGQSDVAKQGSITADEWNIYKAGFVSPEGRVIDAANGNISHSEGQGYGLILSYLANDRAGFDQIWNFTRTELMVRGDDLAAWKWSPDAPPHVTDDNNASDGDILIAYGLALGGRGWNDEGLTAEATRIARATAEHSIKTFRGMDILLPGQFGFGRTDRPDGPVVNLSYWVFEALPVLADLAPSAEWDRLSTDGRRLVASARFGDAQLPTEWVALGDGSPQPAQGFPEEFSYNSVRIPLYLMRAGFTQPALLKTFADHLTQRPATIDLGTDKDVDPLTEVGYRAIGAAAACVLGGPPLGDDLKTFSQQSYYGSTLHLLVLSYLRTSAPQCL